MLEDEGTILQRARGGQALGELGCLDESARKGSWVVGGVQVGSYGRAQASSKGTGDPWRMLREERHG